MTVVTRFAPSPTGFLHIGGARTALFNWLFSRHHGGKFLLRIEDTDRARSSEAAVQAILDGLSWLGLHWDGEPLSQFSRRERHAQVALKLLEMGHAYRCYCTPAELAAMRERALAEGRTIRYEGTWRDRDPAEAPQGAPYAIRLRAPTEGDTVIDDLIQGQVRVANAQLDDMILLRADGTPTYMLAVVVDDHDMGVTHVIRGDDHLTNAFRQYQIYAALGWDLPAFAHLSLIHGPDGAKLSKRHGALGVDAYREMGYLPEALRNYLLRLGWSHGDDEIISTEQAVGWFGLESVGRSPARFDFDKLASLNGHYLREADDGRLSDLVMERIPGILVADPHADAARRIRQGMRHLKERAKTVVELAEAAAFYAHPRPLPLNEKAEKILDGEGRLVVAAARQVIAAIADWSAAALEQTVREFAEARGVKLGAVAQPIRAAVTGSNASPPIFDVMAILGKEETLGRLGDIAK
jgi:glutamyl-tRNA synthetase